MILHIAHIADLYMHTYTSDILASLIQYFELNENYIYIYFFFFFGIL